MSYIDVVGGNQDGAELQELLIKSRAHLGQVGSPS